MIWERWAELIPANRAVSFWEMPWASMRSHNARGSTLRDWAGSTLAGPFSASSTRAWTAGLMFLSPRDTWVM